MKGKIKEEAGSKEIAKALNNIASAIWSFDAAYRRVHYGFEAYGRSDEER